MENMRLILILALAFVLFLIYQAWVEDYGTPPVIDSPTGAESSPPASPGSSDRSADTPDAPAVAAPTLDAAAPDQSPTSAVSAAGSIVVETDVLRAEISPRGGTIQSLELLNYRQDADDPTTPLQLLKPAPPNMFIVQSGLLGGPNSDLPTHDAIFSAARDRYRLGDDEDALTVELTWQNEAGLEVIKRYRFERGRYLVHASQELINGSETPISARDYQQLQRTELYDPGKSSFIHTYTGGVYYGPEVKYKKESFDEMSKRPLDVTVADGWVAMIQHYFMAAWIPPAGVEETFYTKVVGGDSRYIIGTYSPAVAIPAGASHRFESRLFAGPKLQDRLAEIAPGLELAVDYGWLTILAEPIFWLLSLIHSVVGNWGWAIIILTILIKAAFYKLSETSYKSMANMRKMTPRIQALKDRYGDDKEKLNQAFMELYKKEKINPLGGCLPILVQIPVFIALYWVLLESVELRHAPFILWLDNLTEPDPFYVLPLIMGVSMFVQQKLNPPPPDPMQAKIFMALPFVFTVFFAFFPAGLVLYWTVNNLLSITQQWYITRKVEKAAAQGGGSTKKAR
ncbi:membrane protein insertase YidC [Halochromatium glycolicum]|uniref:Membrane protein insertase YidC n=1 Tax=Halochromatium glycolicum TaxID=85075 RepID=A0AAJ0X9K1_9GAMM|nr:membrane protein insertase YidC [Halochromatium glycolicum]MBK1704884.1 membrane protein insertase YidC [Halochromatium glycolicum]